MNIITKVLNRKELIEQPPVLVDIGASGQIHKKWKKIASHSICIAFDADDREFGFVTKATSGFKKLNVFNCIVSDKEEKEIDFYLTTSPYCSSTLVPDEEALSAWAFADKFSVDKKIKLKTMSLQNALQQVNIDYVDWFKTDSQGTDVRLFKNLGDKNIQNVIVAEFEPGIIDAYKGEDKFFELLQYMADKNFWLSSLTIKGSQRITKENLSKISSNKLLQKLIHFSLITSPGWSETSFINDFKKDLSLRNYLLGWVFTTILEQHGFAYHIASVAKIKFNDDIFSELMMASSKALTYNVLKLKFIPSVFEKLSKILKIQ
jgi:FkbM family methyltransferase